MKIDKMGINTQAENEVKELLHEYVVSPLKEPFGALQASLDHAANNTAEAKKNTDGLSGQIVTLTTQTQEINSRIGEAQDERSVFETIVDSKTSICKEIASLKTDLAKPDGTLSGMETRLKNSTKENAQTLLGSITSVSEKLDISADAVKQELNGLEEKIGRSLSDSSERMQRELLPLQAVKPACEEINKKIDDLAQTLEQRHTELAERQAETKAELDQYKASEGSAEKQYKTLLTVSAAIGAINIVGIVTLILLISRLF